MTPAAPIPEPAFERRSRRTALAVTLAVHLGAMALFGFWTCSVPTEPKEELTEIAWGGGGGGSPDFVGPEGPAMRGAPAASPQSVPPVPAQKDRINVPASRTPSRETVASRKEEKKPERTERSPAETPTKPEESAGKEGSGGQNPSGTGDKPASGSGGPGVGRGSGGGAGYGINGMGTRGWIVRPSARYPEGSSSTGNVVLRFTVMPNGDVTNITPIKRADAALVNAAVAGLRRARARPLPAEAPQAPQTATITYTFRLD